VHPLGETDPDPRFTPRLEKLLQRGYIPKIAVSSMYEKALSAYRELGYEPVEVSNKGCGLFYDIKPEDLIKIAARRPRKITRALMLVHKDDKR